MIPFADNRRRHARMDADCQVLAGEYKSATMRARGWTVDLGPGGCRMISEESLTPGSDVRLILLVRGKLLLTTGRVVHARCLGDAEYEVGVEFRHLRPHAQSALDGLLKPSKRPEAATRVSLDS